MKLKRYWNEAFTWLENLYLGWIIRISLFAIYFWFGAVKLTGLSQATPLARALTTNTIGARYFATSFIVLAVIECIIGILFLIPKLTRVTVLIALIHMTIVCSPLILVPGMAWQRLLVPTIEGQYIIKNLALVSLMLALLKENRQKST